MSLWSDLVSTALIGTDRRPVPSPPADSPLALAYDGAEPDRLLDVAAAVTLARRAATRARGGQPPPAAAPPETRAPVPPPAAARLRRLLRDQPRGQQSLQQRVTLLTEWLGLARRHRLLVPASALPQLLEEARVREQWRAVVADVGGARAVWLAGQHPNWAWLLNASTVDDETRWLEGTPAQRLSYLSGLRARDPDRARELLVQAWPDEPAAGRAALLSIMDVRLTRADEELCERALDDRRKEVRVVAAGLLATLPGSAYQQRMRQRGLTYLTRHPDGELLVTPPTQCDPAMRRDGIEPRAPQGTGERAWWLEQVLLRTPLPVWRELEAEPAPLLRWPVADGWSAVVHRAWAQATVDQQDPVWAAAFVGSDSPAMSRATAAGAALVQSLYRQLAPPDATRVAVAMLAADDPYAEFVLSACPRPWSPALVAATMSRLRRFGARPGRLLSILVTQAAIGFPPELAPAAAELAGRYRVEHGDDDPHAPFYDRLADTLTFRHQMHQEFE